MSQQLEADLPTRVSALPFPDRMWLLVSTVLERGEAFNAVASLADLMIQLSRHFNVINRFRIAEVLRLAADKIEHERPAAPYLIERN